MYYPSLKLLAWILGLDPSTVSRMLNSKLERVWISLEEIVSIPPALEQQQTAQKL
jgi:hypothetical protein